MARRRRRSNYEFKPDAQGKHWLKLLHLTQYQQKQLLRWGLYSALCVFLLVIQDVIMARVHFLGATTDLAVIAIFLISIMEDSDNGGLFALIAAMVYEFSGSAPGPYVIALIPVLAIALAIFRQVYWRRSFTSNVLCAAIAVMAYEILVWGLGVFMQLTYPGRLGVFLLTGLISCMLLIPLYPAVHAIGKIGGEIWKE